MKTFILFMLIFFSINGYSQSYLDSYDGIPLIVYTWASDGDWLYDYNYADIKLMGGDAVIHPELNAYKFGRYKEANIRMIPYQQNPPAPQVNYITYYTEAIYTKWEAETTNPSDGEVKLETVANYVDEIAGVGIKTKNGLNTADYILKGPGYIQPLDHRILEEGYSTVIDYDIDFNLKINGDPFLIQSNINEPICKIEAVYEGGILDERILTAVDFQVLDSWKTFKLIYNKHDVSPPLIHQKYSMSTSAAQEYITKVEYKIYFYGLPYLTLYCDYILVSDRRGRNLFNNPGPSNDIIAQATNDGNINKFIENDNLAYDTLVVGWFAIDEHDKIDNWACVNKVSELLRENTNKRLITSISGPDGGKVWTGADQYRVDEYIRRAKPDNIIFNHYLYHYPKNPNESGYKEFNIFNAAENNLKRFSNYDIPFYFNIQTGKWLPYLEVIPSEEQFLYSMNLGLLYGAKGIALGDYFFIEGSTSRTALVSFTNTAPPIYDNEDLWATVQNSLSPKLKGDFGKTLKKINQQYQSINYNAINAPTINDSYWLKKIELNSQSQTSDECIMDYGFFTDPIDAGKKYLMAVNRYYSTLDDLKFTFRNLSTYKNWEVENLVNGNKQTILASSGNEAVLIDNIPNGDAALYKVLPVVKYGGNLKFNETISGTNTLYGEMIINSGAALTVYGIYNIYKNIIVNSGGSIVIIPGAQLKFHDGASLIVNGTLNAQGIDTDKITFERGGTSGYWGTIRFDGASSSNSILDYVEIKYSTKVEFINSADATIQNSNIENGFYGIYIYNSAPKIINNKILNNSRDGVYGQANGKSPVIKNNEIKRSGSKSNQGVYLQNYTSPFITGNDIKGFYYGIYYAGGGSGFLTDESQNTPTKNNRLTNNNIGLAVAWGSYLTAGIPTYPYKGGRNSIWGNTNFDAQAYQSGTIIACRNWWGSDGIQTDVFSGGYINSSLPLTSDPWAGSPPPMSNPITNNNSGDGNSEILNPENPDDSFAEIYTGISLETEGRINDAVNHYKQMINNDVHPGFAFSSLARIKNRFSREDIEVYFNSLSSEKNLRGELKLIAANLLASMLLDKGNYAGAINIYDRILNQSPTSYYGITAMFEKYFAALNYKKDRELAASLLGEIQSLPYDDEEFLIRKEMAEFLLYGFQESDNKFGKPLGSSDNNSIEIPKEFSLLGNYPNPFNPTTNISYSLPFASSVDLTIYDIMGREIKSFVFSSQSSGIQNIIWDGRNSNGENVSSGIYLYRIRLQSLENNESFEKTAKLIMMK